MPLGERYHAPSRSIFSKFRNAEPTILPEMALTIAQKSLNDTMEPNGLVPTLLVYGILPCFPVADADFPDQQAFMRALAVARREMETVVAKLRISRSLRSRIPAAANYIINPGDRVQVFN